MLSKTALSIALFFALQHVYSADYTAWANFYQTNDCSGDKYGKDSYDVQNDNCFFNSGPFLKLHGDTSQFCSVTIKQYEDDCSTSVKHQFDFDPTSGDCYDLENLGFSTGPDGAAGDYAFDVDVNHGGC